MTLKWKRDGAGRQVETTGRYAVECDGYERGAIGFMDRGEFVKLGDGGEWAAILIDTNENLDWFPTMREAKAYCERHAR